MGFLGDFDLAEEAAQEAFAIAAERWPRVGTPANPGAWLITTARNRAIDRQRRERTLAAKTRLLDVPEAVEDDVNLDETSFPDERLELIFTCCHPALATEAQVALTLRALGGLATEEIARAFLVAPETMKRRLSRAKSKVKAAWTGEQVLGSMPYAAACTERLRLGCAIVISPLHIPLHLAKSISSLDQLSGGRVEIGIGTGGRSRMFSAFGVDPDSLVSRFTEGLRLMQAMWTESRVNFDGRFWQLNDAAMEPKPFQKPHPPIWFGGGHPDALRRAARLADGFIGAGSSTTAQEEGGFDLSDYPVVGTWLERVAAEPGHVAITA